MFGGGVLGDGLLLAMVVVSTVTAVLCLRDILVQSPRPRTVLVAVAIALCAQAGCALLMWAPRTAQDTSCLFGPATNVLSHHQAEPETWESSGDGEQGPDQACLEQARTQVWWGVGLVAVAATSCGAVRRSRRPT